MSPSCSSSGFPSDFDIRSSVFAALLLVALLGSGALAEAAAADAPVYRGHAIALHGDPKHPAGFPHFDYVNPAAPKGGTLRLSREGGFDSLNPFIPRGNFAYRLDLMYDTLMVNSDDEPFTMYGLLAQCIELPADRSWVAFDLRPEARWHDGRPVTAEDVVFSHCVLTEKGAPHYRLYYHNVLSATAEGERRVRFALSTNEVNRELPLIVGQLPILPRHYWEGRDFGATTLEPPLGGGAYRIGRVDANRLLVFERVTNYWARDLNVKVGMENFDVIRFDYYRDAVVELEAFKAGECDWMMESSAKNWATAYDIPEARAGLLRKEVIPHGRPAPMQALAFNLRRPLFQDRRVREALTHAIDFEWANRRLMYGAYTRFRSYFGNTELEARGAPGAAERAELADLARRFGDAVPPEALTREYQPPGTGEWTDARGHALAVRRNLRRAQQLLREAGWGIRSSDRRLVHAGLPDARGRPLEFEFEILLYSPLFERIVLPFRQSLRKLGIEARVRTVDASLFMNRAISYDYDMVVASWEQTDSPGNEQRAYWTSAAADEPGGYNAAGIRNPAIDEAVRRLIESPDRATLVTRTRVLDRLLQWGVYGIPCWYLPADRIASWDKIEHPAVTPMNGTSFLFWWADPEKERTLPDRIRALRGR